MTEPVFVDTNVLVYSRDARDAAKHERAREWVEFLWDTKRGYTNLCIYNAGRETYAVCVMNAARNIVFYKGFSAKWLPGQ